MRLIRLARRTVLEGTIVAAMALTTSSTAMAGKFDVDEAPFLTDSGLDLRQMVDPNTRVLLQAAHGVGAEFGPQQQSRYCELKHGDDPIQWVVNNLQTGEIVSRSANADELYFGASTSKLFVAAAFLDKVDGQLTEEQLRDLVRMIVVSSNSAWLKLQRMTGEKVSDYDGRVAVQAFVTRMGYPKTQGFQGWIKHQDGTRIHGNELNAIELAQFLRDTYMREYPGADVLWEVMKATRTGSSKINKYTPADLHIGGKTGTYSGPNASPATIQHATIGARNHAAVLFTERGVFGISVLSNTSENEDVAVLGGGLMREYLDVEKPASCR